ncbi:septum formation inhibitor Maf [Neiella sp. HB171785]|uniref:dTTP/UTP pyrophosphatase n=1 Tax=Neiella litorisoli TaxID=2771431 RepID=A0A8J6QHS2_9GAMM|nr:Maf family protein [Neiella litorisoli]MBD1389874.1 septum formation inhibitor Maf [Neiella litorisoli]
MKLSLPLVLASQSPRRRELLGQLVNCFEQRSADIDEVRQSGESPSSYVARLAREKAQTIAHSTADKWVLGADTIVVLGSRIFEKPADEADCLATLSLLSGQTHQVMTAVALCKGEQLLQQTVISDVTFRTLSRSEIQAYWQTGEPADKAGSYGIQGLAGCFVSHLSGSYSAVVGLPLCQTHQMLQAAIKES